MAPTAHQDVAARTAVQPIPASEHVVTDLQRATRPLHDVVATGELVGWVAGLWHAGTLDVLHGGRRSIGGPSMTADAEVLLRPDGVMEGGPLAEAMAEQGIAPGPFPPRTSPEEYLRRLGALPLAHQPGEAWMYHTSSDVLGVLLARATGRPLRDLVAERLTGPLGMTDTGFWTREADRMATAYGEPWGTPTRPPAGRCCSPSTRLTAR